MFFLDTNTCIYYLNGKYVSVKDKILSTPPSEIKIPAIVKFYKETLITNNVREFGRVADLKIKNWVYE